MPFDGDEAVHVPDGIAGPPAEAEVEVRVVQDSHVGPEGVALEEHAHPEILREVRRRLLALRVRPNSASKGSSTITRADRSR